MSGMGAAPTVIAMAILLSVVVRGIRGGVAWGAVDDGAATADHLREITGIFDWRRLQEVFGPPRLEDGVFPVTRGQVRRNRTTIGWLMGDRWLDGASAVLALAALIPVWPLWSLHHWIETPLYLAGLYQLVGWAASFRLLGKR
jgi:hypothetical protein